MDGFLGYAQFPGGPANTNGVVSDYRYFGTTGTATAPFALGRTATHEVGHYLNLYHIWCDGGCGVDDLVGDTPTSDAPNYGCPNGHTSCGTTDMIENYMDYSDDSCMNLYTEGQKNRMHALFGAGGSRVALLSSTACGSAPEPTCTDGIQNGQETGVDCGGPDCDPCQTNGCNNFTATLTIIPDLYGSETTWMVLDGNTVLYYGGPYPDFNDTPVQVEMCLEEGCYEFVINDSYGDGICCDYGSGSYAIDFLGTTIVSGGTFGYSQTEPFCIGEPADKLGDAGVFKILSPSGNYCNGNISLKVRIKNFDEAPLTLVYINYQVDNGTVYSHAWSGNLAANATVNVALPDITVNSGNHTFTAFTSNPNGVLIPTRQMMKKVGAFPIHQETRSG